MIDNMILDTPTTRPLPRVQVYTQSDRVRHTKYLLEQAKDDNLIHNMSTYRTDTTPGPDQVQSLPHVYVDDLFIGGDVQLRQYLSLQKYLRLINNVDDRCFLAITANWCGPCKAMKHELGWENSDSDGVQTYTHATGKQSLCITVTDAFISTMLMQSDIDVKMYPTIFEYIDGIWTEMDMVDYMILLKKR